MDILFFIMDARDYTILLYLRLLLMQSCRTPHVRFGCQQMTSEREMRKCALNLGIEGAPCLRGWGPKHPSTSWMETLKDMATNREWCKSCYRFLSNQNVWEIWVYAVWLRILDVSYCGILFFSHRFISNLHPPLIFILFVGMCDSGIKAAVCGAFPAVERSLMTVLICHWQWVTHKILLPVFVCRIWNQ